MRYFSLLLLLSACSIGFVLPAPAQHPATNKVKVKKADKKLVTSRTASPATAGPVLTFERTPCNGRCPAYFMQVYADGRVAYEGRRDVPMTGQHTLKLSPAAVTEMLRQAHEAHFETFEPRYAHHTSDLPSTVVTIRQPNGTLKAVAVEEGAPENVNKFFAYLGNQLDQLAQLNGVEK